VTPYDLMLHYTPPKVIHTAEEMCGLDELRRVAIRGDPAEAVTMTIMDKGNNCVLDMVVSLSMYIHAHNIAIATLTELVHGDDWSGPEHPTITYHAIIVPWDTPSRAHPRDFWGRP